MKKLFRYQIHTVQPAAQIDAMAVAPHGKGVSMRSLLRPGLGFGYGGALTLGCWLLGTLAIVPCVPALAQTPKTPAIVLPTEVETDRKPTLVTKGNCLIKGGTVITVTKGVLPATDVLVQNGKITEIGKNLSAPSGTVVIDATGRFVTPGIIDAHSHIASDSTNEGTDSITAEVRIEDVLAPDELSIWHGLSNGVTTSLVLHGSANAIGGQSLVIKMKYKKPMEELMIPDAPRMIKFALGENVKRSFRFPGEPNRYPVTRMGVETVYRRAFSEAKDYMKRWESYDKAVANLKSGETAPQPPRRDLRLETLSEILKRKIWVQCHSYRADEMLMMVRLSQEFGFKIGALQHALEAYKIAPELAAAHIPISTFADAWGYKVEAYDAIPYNAALCTRAGVIASVNSDNGSGSYRLNLEAAKSIKFGGLNEAEAWKLITINPAIQLGIEGRTGSIEVGKDADICLWQGNPMTVSSKAQLTLVEGEVFFQRRDAWKTDASTLAKTALPISKIDPLTSVLPARSKSYAITGATIHPISGATIPNGVIVFENGTITGVGVKPNIPKGAVLIDAKGLHIFPGMIDAGSGLGLSEIEQVSSTLDGSESGMFQPDVQASVAIHADSAHIPIARCGGLTTALSLPGGRGGLIAGQGAIFDLDGWTREEMNLNGATALHLYFPGGVGANSLLATEEAVKPTKEATKNQIKLLKEYFEKAKRYQSSRKLAPDSVPFDSKFEAMLPYLEGKTGHPHGRDCKRNPESDQIRRRLRFEGDYRWRNGIHQSRIPAREKKIPVIYGLTMENSLSSALPADPYSPYDTMWAGPAQLVKAGVKVCFASNSASSANNLPTQAGITTGYGMSSEGVMKALTQNAAEILGISDRVGTLEVGKLANLIVTDGDPTEIATHIRNLFIGGNPSPSKIDTQRSTNSSNGGLRNNVGASYGELSHASADWKLSANRLKLKESP